MYVFVCVCVCVCVRACVCVCVCVKTFLLVSAWMLVEGTVKDIYLGKGADSTHARISFIMFYHPDKSWQSYHLGSLLAASLCAHCTATT